MRDDKTDQNRELNDAELEQVSGGKRHRGGEGGGSGWSDGTNRFGASRGGFTRGGGGAPSGGCSGGSCGV